MDYPFSALKSDLHKRYFYAIFTLREGHSPFFHTQQHNMGDCDSVEFLVNFRRFYAAF